MSLPFARIMNRLQPSFLKGIEPETAEALRAMCDPVARMGREQAEALATAYGADYRPKITIRTGMPRTPHTSA